MTISRPSAYEPFESAGYQYSGIVFDSASTGKLCGIAYSTFYSLTLDTTSSPNVLDVKTKTAQIRIYGRNLQRLVSSVALSCCCRITEFNPSFHLPPPNDEQPFIERIEINLHSQYN